MPLCTNDCNCNGGNCDMSSCKGWSCNCGAGGCSGPMNARQLAELIPKIVIPIVVALGVLFCWWRKRKNRKMAETAYAPTQTQDQMFPVKQGA
ncbi:predicted protein [Chaetoceros tenuissimus]|uniref:Uncharacterized protein n=1 Tax=Chaetoceros tenuissimus TaxID=426638 RepID=A0AAD3H239_9STRA|nr:predicted protein [Chaetoceros tenuissimus]